MMKKAAFAILLVGVIVLAGCTTTYTTTMTPDDDTMLVTSGDLPHVDYVTLGFVEGTAQTIGLGLPSETMISQMKSDSMNQGLVQRARDLGADAVINVEYSSAMSTMYFFLQQTTMNIKGTAVRYK